MGENKCKTLVVETITTKKNIKIQKNNKNYEKTVYEKDHFSYWVYKQCNSVQFDTGFAVDVHTHNTKDQG